MLREIAKFLTAGVSVGAFAALPLGTLAAQTEDKARTVLVVLAHPDDEMVIAPAIAAEVRQGAKVRLLYATTGDAGPGVSKFEAGQELGEARRAEALCAGKALGASVRFLDGIGDGTLSRKPRDTGSAANRFLEFFPDAYLEVVPDVVVTWGPDGGYGHGDHRMVNALVTQALQSLDEDARPQLLYPTLIHTPLPPPLEEQGWAITAPDLATVHYRYTEADLAAANSAAQCHKTQFDDATRGIIVPGFHQAVWKGEVSFREAF